MVNKASFSDYCFNIFFLENSLKRGQSVINITQQSRPMLTCRGTQWMGGRSRASFLIVPFSSLCCMFHRLVWVVRKRVMWSLRGSIQSGPCQSVNFLRRPTMYTIGKYIFPNLRLRNFNIQKTS